MECLRVAGTWYTQPVLCPLGNMHTCPPRPLRGAQMRLCLHQGCVSLGKVM